MANKGKLYLIPNVIAEGTEHALLTPQLREILPEIRHFLAENVRTARRYLSSLKIYDSIEALHFVVLDKNTDSSKLADLMTPISAGMNVGVISESGCPGVADPGALAVSFAHKNRIQVVPLVGASSILLAIMGSGLNGQKFAFHGYLPVDAREAATAIKAFEKESKSKNQTQIFIETPYRNNAILQVLIKNLAPGTVLTVAKDLTGPNEFIQSKTVNDWAKSPIALEKIPAVFLFLA